MAMPLNSFTALAALNSLRTGRERELVLSFHRDKVDAIARFRLYCFILFDPDHDADLTSVLSRRWEFLDSGTGEDLLFFAPVDPPARWAADPAVRGRPLMQWASQQGAPDVEALHSQDAAGTARWLSMILGKPVGLGPSLVITESLWASSGWMMRTSGQLVERQLSDLRFVAGALQPRAGVSALREAERLAAINTPRLESELARLAAELDMPLVRVNWRRPLDELLLSVLESVAAREGERVSWPQQPKDLVEGLEAECRLRLSASVRGSDELALLQASTLPILADRAAWRSFGREGRGFGGSAASADAARYLRQGDELLRVVESGRYADLDYRSPCLHWSLAVEHELAEVLGHDVRKSLGVELPKYFWRHQPDLLPDSIVVENGDPIPFNRADPDTPRGSPARWQPPELGRLLKGWKKWYPSVAREGFKEFTQLWGSIARMRNPMAHPKGEVTKEVAVSLRRRVAEIFDVIPGWRA